MSEPTTDEDQPRTGRSRARHETDGFESPALHSQRVPLLTGATAALHLPHPSAASNALRICVYPRHEREESDEETSACRGHLLQRDGERA